MSEPADLDGTLLLLAGEEGDLPHLLEIHPDRIIEDIETAFFGCCGLLFGWSLFGIVAIFVIQPAYAGGDYPHVEAFPDYGSGNPFSVIFNCFTDIPIRPWDMLLLRYS